MIDETNSSVQCSPRWKGSGSEGVSGGIYGLAFIGALIYYLIHATSFWDGVLGFLKALVWPAILIYMLLEFLKM
jgi:hypothetical protein